MGFFDKFGSSIINGASGIVGGLLGLANTNATNKANLRAVQETNRANRELAQYNWDQQIDMWNRNNEYNSPIQQMQRLKDAGLNPNLVYGNGVTGNTSGSIPTPATPTMQAPKFQKADFGFIGHSSAAAVQAYQQQRQIDSQVELQKTQQEALRSQNLVNNAKIAEIMQRTSRSQFDLDLAKELRTNTVAASNLSVKQAAADLERKSQDLADWPLRRQQMMGSIALMEANRNLSVKQADKISAEIMEISAKVANLAANTRLTNARADVESDPNYKQNLKVKLYGEAIKAVASGQTQRLERNWRKRYGWTGSFNSATSAVLEGSRSLEFYNNHSSYAE